MVKSVKLLLVMSPSPATLVQAQSAARLIKLPDNGLRRQQKNSVYRLIFLYLFQCHYKDEYLTKAMNVIIHNFTIIVLLNYFGL